jgi:hypothetical protein
MSGSWGEREFAGAIVGDRRCTRSLARIAEALGERHGLSFSAACGNALRQAAHRIFAREHLTLTDLLNGHFRETAQRAREWCPDEPLLVAQDTTELNYAGHHATLGLGYLSGSNPVRGLIAHSALAVTSTGLPLGLLWAQIWARDFAQQGKKHQRIQRTTAQKESRKWQDGLAGIQAVLPTAQPAVIIADREADFFDYFLAPRRPGIELLIRAHQPRRVLVEAAEDVGRDPETKERETNVVQALAETKWGGHFSVSVPARAGQPAREAQMAVRWVQVQMLLPRDYRRRRPEGASAAEDPAPVRAWVVEAQEREPPNPGTALHWVLLTTLPVESVGHALRIVGYYTRRWVIERLHYTLKSGLRVERLQIDDAHSLQHALGVCFVVAWHLLWLTHLAREQPDGDPTEMLPAEGVTLLEQATGQPITTRRAALRAIAKLGGFPGNPSAGEPGVKTLWLGWMCYTAMLDGWRLANRAAGASYATR